MQKERYLTAFASSLKPLLSPLALMNSESLSRPDYEHSNIKYQEDITKRICKTFWVLLIKRNIYIGDSKRGK
jgi:hypothetical protein